MSPGTFVTIDEKSVTDWLTESRMTVTPFALRAHRAASARPVEYVSWSSMM